MLSGFWRWLRGHSNRNIFRYWDGRRYLLGDPLQLFRGIVTDGEFSWDTTPQLMAMSGDDAGSLTVRLEAMQVAADMVRRVFRIRSLSDRGLTDLECIELLWEFNAYSTAVKKNGRSLPTSPASTESSPAVTSPSSGSTSTGTEPGPELPIGPPAESVAVCPDGTD